jgi:hypothetical protein
MLFIATELVKALSGQALAAPHSAIVSAKNSLDKKDRRILARHEALALVSRVVPECRTHQEGASSRTPACRDASDRKRW